MYSLFLSLIWCVHLNVHLFLCKYIHIHLVVCTSIYMYIYLYVHLFIYAFIYIAIYYNSSQRVEIRRIVACLIRGMTTTYRCTYIPLK